MHEHISGTATLCALSHGGLAPSGVDPSPSQCSSPAFARGRLEESPGSRIFFAEIKSTVARPSDGTRPILATEMMSSSQDPPQPYVSEDAVHRAFGGGPPSGQAAGSTSFPDLTGMPSGMGWQGGGNDDSRHYEDEEEYEDEVFRPTAALVTDYRCEIPEEEGEGHAYNIEKRHIRETVELADSYVFVWGDGQFGKLGHQTIDSLHVPYIVSSLQRIPIRMCALGRQHSLFLSTDGYVLACGSAAYGQLGNGDDTGEIMVQVLKS